MKNEYEKISEKAINYMRNNLSKDITTEELASYVGYSKYHFIRVFKETTGVSPRHYLSALRIEMSKEQLSHSTSSILKVILSLGFRSMGSFSSRFKQFVGLSPKEYRLKIDELYKYLIHFQISEPSNLETNIGSTPTITCSIKTPPNFKGIIFIGLFPRPIPDQRPVVGTAFFHQKKECIFSNVPYGEYYLLSAGISYSLNPRKYFLSDSFLRGKLESALKISESTNIVTSIQLREPLPCDPPILINLPLLLFEKNKAN
ncbi:AraC family transcriptional regulator [Heyndrickxia sporothermodurans]|nr:AraC family transcriptional regulator [Heyndrickxia sporothermodurans]